MRPPAARPVRFPVVVGIDTGPTKHGVARLAFDRKPGAQVVEAGHWTTRETLAFLDRVLSERVPSDDPMTLITGVLVVLELPEGAHGGLRDAQAAGVSRQTAGAGQQAVELAYRIGRKRGEMLWLRARDVRAALGVKTDAGVRGWANLTMRGLGRTSDHVRDACAVAFVGRERALRMPP